MGFFDFLFGTTKKVDEVMQHSDREVLHLGPSQVDTFREEFSSEIYDIHPIQSYNSYFNNGVELKGNTRAVRIVYDGLLARSGAQEVHAAVGYGNNLKWEDIDYYPLHKLENQTFELLLPVKRDGNINVAFKDSAGNWDNNSGMNYCFNNQFYESSY